VKKALLQIAYLLLLYAWSAYVHDFYYRFELANKVALFSTLLIGLLLGRMNQNKKTSSLLYFVAIISLPLAMQPLAAQLIANVGKSWLIIFILGVISSFAAGRITKLPYLILGCLALTGIWLFPSSMPDSQKDFVDKVITSIETDQGEAQIVEWKDHYWLHYDDKIQFSTLDKHVLGEAFALPAVYIKEKPINALVLGGDNQLIASTLQQLDQIKSITAVPFDQEYHHFVLINRSILSLPEKTEKRKISTKSIAHHLYDSGSFDLIYIDFPIKLEITELIRRTSKQLNKNGIIIMPTGNPYLAATDFKHTYATLEKMSWTVLPYHTQVPTKGQESWMLICRDLDIDQMKKKLLNLPMGTHGIWWNQEAMNMMLSFGNIEYFIRD